MKGAGREALRAALSALLVVGLGCSRHDAKRFEGHGIVRDVQPADRQVVISHDDIEGLMPAMTMNFDVPDAGLLATLAAGQEIAFQVEFTGQSYRVVEAEILGNAGADDVAAPTLGGVVAERDEAPAFQLTDQDGRPLSLADLRGKTVMLDFIFTHCTGPCPVLTGLQRDVQRALTPEQRARTHFVSITLDPERDKPEILRSYAKAHGADLAVWSFLTGPPEVVDAVVRSYGVGVIRRAGEEPAHLVASFVIDPQGRIAHRIVGLEQSADERARLLAQTAGTP
jgi:protein SCO1/2